MAVFHIYVDESGKLTSNADYTCLGGYIGHESQWAMFSERWNIVRLKWGVPPIHMSRIVSPDHKNDEWKTIQDKWGENWVPMRDDMLADFAKIVAGAGLVAIGAVVDANRYRQIKAQSNGLSFPDSNVFALHRVVMRGIERVSIVDPNATISIIVDDDPEYAWHYYLQLKELKSHPNISAFGHVKNRIHGISFVNDSSYPGIQAADMLAWVVRNYMVEKKQNAGVEASALFLLLTQQGTNQPGVYDAETLQKLADNTIEAMRVGNENE